MTTFGAGPSLDENFDFAIHPTGDLKASGEREELNKDLAMQLRFSLDKFAGSPPTTNVEAEATDTAIKVVEADQRVTTVLKRETDVTLSDDTRTLTINLKYVAIDGEEYSFVYEI